MVEWPDEISGEVIEHACDAARMGVTTAIVMGSARIRRLVQTNLALLLAHDAQHDLRFGVPTWVFRGGGVLLLVANQREATVAYARRGGQNGPPPEVIYPKIGHED